MTPADWVLCEWSSAFSGSEVSRRGEKQRWLYGQQCREVSLWKEVGSQVGRGGTWAHWNAREKLSLRRNVAIYTHEGERRDRSWAGGEMAFPLCEGMGWVKWHRHICGCCDSRSMEFLPDGSSFQVLHWKWAGKGAALDLGREKLSRNMASSLWMPLALPALTAATSAWAPDCSVWLPPRWNQPPACAGYRVCDGIWLSLQAQKWADSCLTDVGRSPEIAGSEKKDLITHGTAGSMSTSFGSGLLAREKSPDRSNTQ